MLSAIIALLHRCGAALDRPHIARYCAMLLAFEVAGFLFFAAGTYGLIVPLKTPATTDFVSFYAAGSLANAGTPELIYDRAAHYAAEERATAPGIAYNYFYYPPVFVLLCALLARLPYLLAFAVFQAAGFAVFLLVMATILREWRWSTLLPVMAFPAVLWNVGLGQTAFLTASLLAGATLLTDRRPVIAGLLFGALVYKPQFGLLIPVALAAGGHWRAFAAAAASVAGLVLLSLLLFGAATWEAFLAAALNAEPVYAGIVKLAGYVTPFGAARLLGAPAAIALAAQIVVSLFAVVVVALAWARGLTLPVRAAVLCSAALVATPVAMWYDLLPAAVAVAWLHVGGMISTSERAVLGALFIVVLYPTGIGEVFRLPIGPLAALALFAMVVRISWREGAAHGVPAEMPDGFAGPRRRSYPLSERD